MLPKFVPGPAPDSGELRNLDTEPIWCQRINAADLPIWWRALSNSRQWIAAALPSSRRIVRIVRMARATRYPITDSHSEVRCLCAATKRNSCLLNSSPTVKDVKLAASPRALPFAR
jgi:hypothetical protein